ncbi:MAG: hypothetical protein JO061_24685 [Acidobacteriaceae bacterium]|nr:hypothetical protein [Acidobacteriaceae bacterium]
MRIRLTPPIFLLLLAVAIGSLVFGIHRYRFRFVRAAPDLVNLVPPGTSATLFFDFDLVRRAHLRIFEPAQAAHGAEYQRFVSETGFDYWRDLDAFSASLSPSQMIFAIKGRFDWDRLALYVRTHQGICTRSHCEAPSMPGRWASWRQLQPDVMLLAISVDRDAVEKIGPKATAFRNTAIAPVWVRLEKSALQKSANWPSAAALLAASLKQSDAVTFSVTGAADALDLHMDAVFASDRQAQTTANQLALETRMLKLEITREHHQPSPANLTGLLTAGSFKVSDREVLGSWPIRNELLEALQ